MRRIGFKCEDDFLYVYAGLDILASSVSGTTLCGAIQRHICSHSFIEQFPRIGYSQRSMAINVPIELIHIPVFIFYLCKYL